MNTQTQSDLLEQLRLLGSDVEQNIRCVNMGGCAAYATLMAARLSELSIPVQGGHSGNWAGTYAHVFIFVEHNREWWYHDSVATVPRAVLKDNREPTCHALITPNILTLTDLETINNTKEWCPFFDRTNIPMIAQIIEKHLGRFFAQPILN